MDDILYKEHILYLYRNPLNKIELEDFDIEQREINPLCGDDITVRIKFDRDTVRDIGHTGTGCAISQAAASLMTEHVKNKAKEDILALTDNDIVCKLGIEINYTRIKCATLCLIAIKNSCSSGAFRPDRKGCNLI